MDTMRKQAEPRPLPPAPTVDIPESPRFRFKNRVLGPPLPTDALEHERLGIPTALAVFSSDCISSSAYATEEILRVLFVAVGLAAFSLVLPVTVAMLVVLFFLILSYRETIKEYPTAGGAYTVTRDNFGVLPAQVAGVSLLTDYILTVAVSIAAGTAALISAFPALDSYAVPIALVFVAIVAFLNLKGVRESGKIFAIPTYGFIAITGLMIVVGIVELLSGNLGTITAAKGMLEPDAQGSAAQGIFYGASLGVMLHAFAVSGTAVTGVEAISNGVSAFRKPEWLNARRTLVTMGCVLGTLFVGISFLASKVEPVPYESGYPTVISQIGKEVFGDQGGGAVLFYILQAGTMLILVLAANTAFADFPRLASFQAGDSFMPRQLTKRGHRLVFSNGIFFLSACAAILIVVTGAKVERLIPLYAIGVFTSFTLSQAGMAKHHRTRREPGWKKGLFINGFGAVLSFVVLCIFIWFKFLEGAWVIVVLVPVMVVALMRLNRQYETESRELEHEAKEACEAPILRRHVVLVFVNRIDQSTARAIQYARALMPDEMRAVHVALDRRAADALAREWTRLGLQRVALELVDCPDRRLTRAALEIVSAELSDGNTEVSVLMPHRVYRRFWHRLLHDHSADEIARVVGQMPHANVTMVPFVLGRTAPIITDVLAQAGVIGAAPHGDATAEPGQGLPDS